jgi:hypothetical protein
MHVSNCHVLHDAAARATAETASAAREPDQRHRQLEQLRTIYRLVLAVDRFAQSERSRMPAAANMADWRALQQNELRHEIVGSVPKLPKCRELSAPSGLLEVIAAAGHAREELAHAFRGLGAEGG